ncbi:hypothetical protein G6F54_014417 [Rhizopus delemar]|nr:hypothetical protein G6F54_014417 [Rhizopus delemar]
MSRSTPTSSMKNRSARSPRSAASKRWTRPSVKPTACRSGCPLMASPSRARRCTSCRAVLKWACSGPTSPPPRPLNSRSAA